ncbi:ABC transporter permease [Tellurirhabdus bombi]|uniref:ABC transporter permease n=1 Tax=Tellurirhabdus bombi TaxID=2907205 RepID=UPI001F170777|nr:ABC transporter permease [Tellurirhabdus bombi]
MNTILLIIKREYLVRVKKKSFIIMTLIGPMLIFGFYALVGYLAVSSIEQKKVEVIDESGLFKNKLKDSESLKYSYPAASFAEAKKNMIKSDYDVLAYIPADIMENPKTLQLLGEKGVSFELKSKIEGAIEREIESIKLTKAGITREVLEDAKVNVDSETISLSAEGEKQSSAGAAAVIGGICAFLIYISVMIYGTQVMRGILEEKTNRIVEVIISSVKPFQLMLGKIIGVALVGLTQFMLWIVLTVGLTSAGTAFIGNKLSAKNSETAQVQTNGALSTDQQALQAEMSKAENPVLGVIKSLQTLNIPLILGCFLFYFLGGYLLYSALFGAIGAAVDSETDTQQFMMPIMLPIIFSFVIAQFVLRDPNGALAFWTSIIPFTSPIIMMVRIPMGVPAWELILSMVLLIMGFVGTTWLASRIYRVGILMYGKKVTYKELSKWIFYKA